MIKVLSIAGSDPSSGAGIQADLKAFQFLGVFGMAVPAALTAQNSRGVSATEAVDPRFLKKQIETLLCDINPAAVKTGMLLTAANISVVAKSVKKFDVHNLIVDPVLRSSSGRDLLEKNAVLVLKKKLFPRALVITPNIPEAEVLTGKEIRSDKDLERAAHALLRMGPSYVLIKGGHGAGPAKDALFGKDLHATFMSSRRKGEFHGTGCLLSSALTVFIARGLSVEKAVEKAKQVVDSLLRRAKPIGKGTARYFDHKL